MASSQVQQVSDDALVEATPGRGTVDASQSRVFSKNSFLRYLTQFYGPSASSRQRLHFLLFVAVSHGASLIFLSQFPYAFSSYHADLGANFSSSSLEKLPSFIFHFRVHFT